MKCPYCKNNRLGISSCFTYGDCGYEGEGTVEFYECDLCGTTVEVCIPDRNPYGRKNRKRKKVSNGSH